MAYTLVWDAMTNQVSDQVIQRDEDGAFIPMDPDNTDCLEYIAWLDEGNEPNPPLANPAPPIEETPPPDIGEVHAQVQDIDARLTLLEDQVANR